MYVYRLKAPTIAVTHDDGKPTLITLNRGTEIRTRKTAPHLPQTGMVDVEIGPDGKIAAMFMQDLETRGERLATGVVD